jgi:hypothetical protein
LSNTNEVEYGVVNRLYAKRTSAKVEDCTESVMFSLVIGRPAVESRIRGSGNLTRKPAPVRKSR